MHLLSVKGWERAAVAHIGGSKDAVTRELKEFEMVVFKRLLPTNFLLTKSTNEPLTTINLVFQLFKLSLVLIKRLLGLFELLCETFFLLEQLSQLSLQLGNQRHLLIQLCFRLRYLFFLRLDDLVSLEVFFDCADPATEHTGHC